MTEIVARLKKLLAEMPDSLSRPEAEEFVRESLKQALVLEYGEIRTHWVRTGVTWKLVVHVPTRLHYLDCLVDIFDVVDAAVERVDLKDTAQLTEADFIECIRALRGI